MHNKEHMDERSQGGRNRSGSGRSSEFGRGSQSRDMDSMDSLDRDSEIGSGVSDLGGEIGSERGSERDADLQREGNLGNERNRNEPDSERRPG
jgi:hypothetical protein